MSTTVLRRALALLVVLVGTCLLPPTPALGAGPCKQYKALNKAGFPQRTLALIDAEVTRLPEGSPTPCARQKAKAERRIARAEAEMSALELVNDPEPGDVRAAVDSALASDRENVRAKAKDAELDAADDEQSLATQASKNWEDFWDDHVVPAKNWGLALLGWLIGAAIALKLLNRMIRNRGLVAARHNPQVTRPPRAVVVAAAMAIVVAGGIIGLLGEWSTFWLGAAVTLVGLGLLALTRREQPRLEITTSGDKAPSAEHVRAVLHQMGADPSRSIELPTASDATFLKDVVVLPETTGVVGKTITALLGLVTPYSPWRLNLEAKTEGTLNVELFRNYERIDRAFLDRTTVLGFLDDKEGAELAKPEVKDAKDTKDAAVTKTTTHDFSIVAAAIALQHMAQAHAFTDVLGGATRWRSVGLEYLARHMSLSDPVRGQILAQALKEDADNVSARLALAHHRNRFDTSVEGLHALWNLTKRVAERTDDDLSPVLKLSARYNHVVAGVNLRATVEGALADASGDAAWNKLKREQELLALPDRDRVREAANLLLSELGRAKGDEKDTALREYAKSMNWAAKTLAWSAKVTDETNPVVIDGHELDWNTTPHYNTACYLASRDNPDVDKAVRHLLLAGETADSEWLGKDPQLRALRKETKFRSTFGAEPRTDVLALPPFTAYADGLRKLGLTTPRGLARASPASLRAAGVPFGLMAELQDAAAFVHSVPEALAALRIEIVAALSSSGYPYARPEPGDRERVLKEILKACEKFKQKPDPQDLASFLEVPREPGAWVHISSIWLGP